MKIFYSVQNFISKKWIYDAIVSMSLILSHNDNVQFYVYYDTEETKNIISEYVSDVIFIKDEWSESFSKRLTMPFIYLGSGILNIFHAMMNYEDFLYLDTDIYCFDKIQFDKVKNLGAIKTKDSFYSRCVMYCNKVNAEERLQELPIINEGCLFQDEIILNNNFKDVLQPLQIKGLKHFGNTDSFRKKKNINFDIFNKIINLGCNYYEYLNYIKGID